MELGGKEELILRQQPFRKILKILAVESLAGEVSRSGESFKVTSNTGAKYKLRYCNSLLRAREIERNVRLLPRTFPPFYGREGRYLLFGWIEGKTLTKDISLEDCYALGKLVGEAHALEQIKHEDPDSYFQERLKVLTSKGICTSKEMARIEARYQELKEKLKVDVVLELTDLHPDNFMKDNMGRIYLVDEEGFMHSIKGLGMIKLFLTKTWLKTKEQQEAFWKGYHEHHSSDYFDKDYQKFITLVGLVQSIAAKYQGGRDYTKFKEKLLQLL
jgi:thiamine kinase-like enzyme